MIEISRLRPIRAQGSATKRQHRITLPPEVQSALGWGLGDKLRFFIDTENDRLVVELADDKTKP
jgi:bifunctional DNA-binding transcriptional regulator/antitoxin component of YhaV-PrlF toxin-antitoxin module